MHQTLGKAVDATSGARSWLRKSPLLVVCAAAAFVSACSLGTETVWSVEARSPDGKWIASGRAIRHSGPGNAAIETNVYLAPAKSPGEETQVLGYFDNYPPGKGGVTFTMTWRTPSHLEVVFSRRPDLVFQAVRYAGIDVSVKDVGTPATGNGS